MDIYDNMKGSKELMDKIDILKKLSGKYEIEEELKA
jgi:hypothetical protein